MDNNINDIHSAGLNTFKEEITKASKEILDFLSDSELEIIEDTEAEDYCMACGNTGRAYGSPFECKECGRKFVGESKGKQVLNNNEESGIKIPRKYLEKGDWKLENTNGSNDGFYGHLDALLETYDYRTGGIGTVYIIAPQGSGSRLWAYTLLKQQESKGAKVGYITPVIDLMESVDRQEALDSDLLVVTLQRYRLKDALEFLDYIRDSRETRGKDTIILSSIPKALILKEGYLSPEDTVFIVKTRD